MLRLGMYVISAGSLVAARSNRFKAFLPEIATDEASPEWPLRPQAIHREVSLEHNIRTHKSKQEPKVSTAIYNGDMRVVTSESVKEKRRGIEYSRVNFTQEQARHRSR